MKVTVAGAGYYGSTLAQLVAAGGSAGEVVLTDVVPGRPQGLALDLEQSGALAGWSTRVTGTNDDGPTEGSNVVVITAGRPRSPGMTRADLTSTNAAIVSDLAERLGSLSPQAVMIVVTNPLDEMTALAAAASGLAPERVLGQAGVLDTARFRYFLARHLGIETRRVGALTLGSHGDTMVPVPSQATIDGEPLANHRLAARLGPAEWDQIVERTRAAGAEIVGLLGTGSAYFAPAASAAAMVEAVLCDTGQVLPAAAWVDGPYGIAGAWVGVPVRLGRAGVTEVVELDLAPAELAALRTAADTVRRCQTDMRASHKGIVA
ncbi:MAG: malate dehydrogenase [Acidimicrobiales bacterium]